MEAGAFYVRDFRATVGVPPRRAAAQKALRLRYDEVAVVLPLAPAAGAAWGEVHRVSLNLERYIDFTG